MTAPINSTSFKPVKTFLVKNKKDFSEGWVQQVIYENPGLLGIGNGISAKDKERRQQTGGRLDLLLEDSEAETRYEVEVQLGSTDESHIIRTIEYWDIERKRHPEFEHIAVIVAEDITSRFFNVISLFNSAIPLIALKLTAIENPDGTVGLLFTRVLDLVRKEPEEEPGATEVVGRNYWKNKTCDEVLEGIDQIVNGIKTFEPRAQLSYNQSYCGIWVNGAADNFIKFYIRKRFFYADIRLERTTAIDELLDNTELKYSYLQISGRYRLTLEGVVNEQSLKIIEALCKQAYEN
ncbi:hypothetical protein [uncultured Parasutterella sp.]|jgi:hypothetical protein|uniref:hypothetical protein n=1 Tax=uncultured Parasutterella sp. TaxID=1263098 RepID=UPI0025F94473|nr:hypothetical protein [uncultured Parasutterella sp.]